MTIEIYWLVLTALMTALFWLPYVLDRIMVRGLWATLRNPSATDLPQSAWAERAMAAHRNAVENLVVFAALVLAAQAIGVSNEITASASLIYFIARFVHFIVYLLGIPVLRTLAFATGWACQAVYACTLLGWI